MSAARTVVLRTSDGVRLVAEHWPADGADDAGRADEAGRHDASRGASGAAAGREIGCVVAHGFTGSARNPHVQRIIRGISGAGIGVLAADFRGHGRSGGRGTAGAEEIHDIAAAVGWLRGAGYRYVAVLGWSMGGTAVLRHAGLGGDADAVVSISAPGLWFERGTRPMRLVHWMFEKRTGRVMTRVLRRTRVSADGWRTLPEAPADVVGAIAPRPLLIVHGDADRYFPLHHVDALSAAAPQAEVWIEAAMGHAEVATTQDLVARIARWVRDSSAAPPVCDDGRRDRP